MNTADSDLDWAIQINNITKAEEALQAGADVNNACLSHAAAMGHVKMVRWLLDKGANIVVAPGTTNHPLLSALHISFDPEFVDAKPNQERIEIARLLVQHGIDVKTADAHGLTPLHLAAGLGLEDLAREFIRRGADVNAVAGFESNSAEQWFLFADESLKRAQTITPLFLATKYHFLGILRMLLEHGAEPNLHAADMTPLQLAAEWGNSSAIEWLLEHGAKPDIPNELGETALHLASKARNVEAVQFLLQHGANVQCRTRMGHTPLYFATLQGMNHAAELLLQAGSDPAFIAPDKETQLVNMIQNAFLHGWPARWITHGMESHRGSIDVESGLPVTQEGCAHRPSSAENNLGLQEYIRRIGLPWNSRKPWLDVIFKPQNYFQQQSQSHEPLRLTPDLPITSEDAFPSFKLVGNKLQVTSTKFAPRIKHPLDYFQKHPPARGAQPPVLGQQWSRTPKTRTTPFVESEFFWGPPGSELAVFKTRSEYSVLDLTLLEWLKPIPLRVTPTQYNISGRTLWSFMASPISL